MGDVAATGSSTTLADQRSDRRFSLLIISDEVGSSDHNEIVAQEAVRLHFQHLIGVLTNALVIKNVGDSLMIRADVSAAEIPTLLATLLRVRGELARRPRASVDLRILVMMLDADFFDGSDIEYEQPDGGASIRGFKDRDPKTWLDLDVFGPSVALAFRASNVPSGGLIVVDELVTDVLEGPASKRLEAYCIADKLWVGPALAFSPFKGLDRHYSFANWGKRTTKRNWKGHLFLRMLGAEKAEVELTPTNDLLLDQQRVRMFTELVWLTNDDQAKFIDYAKWLKSQEKNAGYIRAIGLTQADWTHVRTKSEESYVPRRTNGLIMISAYHNHQAYEAILGRVIATAGNARKPSYWSTSEVYLDSVAASERTPDMLLDAHKALFVQPDVPTESRFVLIYGRWKEEERGKRRPQDATSQYAYAVASLPKALKGSVRLLHAGLLRGGLWDSYCLLSAEEKFPSSSDRKACARICEGMWGYLSRNALFDAILFRICDVLEQHADTDYARSNTFPSTV